MCTLAEHMHRGCVHMISTDIPGAEPALGDPFDRCDCHKGSGRWLVFLSLATLDFYLIT